MNLERNALLVPALSTKVLDRPYRLLMYDLPADQVWCIELPRMSDSGRVKGYVPGPRVLKATDILDALEHGHVKQEPFVAPGFWAMSDADYLAETCGEVEKVRREKRLKIRDAAWDIIAPIVTSNSLQSLLRASTLRPQILKQASAHDVSTVTVYRLLHLYWAHGSIRNGLIPSTHRCGGPGQERRIGDRHIGRVPRAFQRGEIQTKGYKLAELDKTRIATAYGLPSKTKAEAYNVLCAAFYSDEIVDSRGTRTYCIRPRGERPSKEQFLYWGEKLSRLLYEDHFSSAVRRKSPTHNGGSSQDLAAAVGQCAMFDSTSTDVYLVSMYNRQVKLPPMTRSLLIEVRSTACIGVYCGWDSPSQATALKTLYCGATNKKEYCRRFEIEIGDDDWPGMLCRTNLVDNGEMRGNSICEAERQFSFGIEYAKPYSGQSKGDVESRHHADHKGFDHTLPGNTGGKPRQRGAPHPADSACLNYFEYMQALLRYIIRYNEKEVPSLAPTEMRVAGIRPTRINILKWLRDHDQRADVPFNLDVLRALTLPEWKATFQYNGIVLKTPDGRRNIPGLRYFSEALKRDERFVLANTTRKVVPVSLRIDPESLSEIWLPSAAGLLRLPNVSSDELLKKCSTIADEVQFMDSEATYRDQHQQERDQAGLAETIAQEQTIADAKQELRKQARGLPHPVSKREARANMRASAAAEQHALASPLSLPFDPTTSPAPRTAEVQTPMAPAAGPCAAMNDFLDSLDSKEVIQ